MLKVNLPIINTNVYTPAHQRKFDQSLKSLEGDRFQKSGQSCVPFTGLTPEVPEEIGLFSQIYKFADPEEMYFLYTECEKGNLEQEHFYKKAPKSGKPIQSLREDIKLVQYARANNIPLIDAYIPKVDDIQDFYKEAKVGDVFDYNDRLAIMKDGKGAIYLDITKGDYFELFPPIQRFINNQGNIGDCYLVTNLMRMYKNPYGRAELLQYFERKGDDISITFPKAEESVVIKGGSLSPSVKREYLLEGAKGFQMLEHAYGVALARENARQYENRLSVRLRNAEMNCDQDAVDKLQKELDVFRTESKEQNFNKVVPDFSSVLVTTEEAARMKNEKNADKGRPAVYSYETTAEYLRGNGSNPFFYGQLFGASNEVLDADEFFETAKEDIGRENISYMAGTINDLVQIRKERTSWDSGIEERHAYEAIPLADGTFNIVNPHSTGFEVNLSQDEFRKFFLDSEKSFVCRTDYKQD